MLKQNINQEYVTAREHAEKKDEVTNRRPNGDNNFRSDVDLKPGAGAYSGNRKHDNSRQVVRK